VAVEGEYSEVELLKNDPKGARALEYIDWVSSLNWIIESLIRSDKEPWEDILYKIWELKARENEIR
jgi:hypothetical protein